MKLQANPNALSLATQKSISEPDEKLISLSVTKRARMGEKFMECEPNVPDHFELINEFTNKYEYFLEGRIRDI
jgi:hypothetical protein